MDKATEQRLLKRNRQIIDMVVERAKRDFPDDIDVIGLTGSFATGDYYEGSDLDLIIINGNDRGWGIADGFILGDVGFDIYCTPWSNIEAKSRLEDVGVSSLTELKILYAARPEHLERLEAYRQKAIAALAEPIGKSCIERADRHIGEAKKSLAEAMLATGEGAVRCAAGGVVHHLANALISLNNTCFTRGIKRYLAQLLALPHLPEGFENLYMAVIEAKGETALREAALRLLRAVVSLRERLWETFVEKPRPAYDNLWGIYEEFWCNYRNKLLASVRAGDKSYAFLAALGAQGYLEEMTAERGIPPFDMMEHFDPGDLEKLGPAYLRALEIYAGEYEKAGRDIQRFDTFEQLYRHYMAT